MVDVIGKFLTPMMIVTLAVLFIKGKPAYLYAAADVNISGGSVAESYVFKIEWKTKK